MIVLAAVAGLAGGCAGSPAAPEAPEAEADQSLASASAASGSSSNVDEIRIQDKCEPDSFNAAIGPGTCIGDENVTFAVFLEKLNLEDGGHGAWRFHPDDTHIDEGETLIALNEGGEVHSISRVGEFGAGIIPELNVVLPPGTPVAPLLEPLGPTFVAAGGNRVLAGLSEGTHRFQCMIHPWMRLELEVREED